LRRQLAEVQADWARLRAVLPDEERARFDGLDEVMGNFVRMRTELARVGVEEGAGAADRMGNNDANRSSREALSRELDRLAESTAATVASRQRTAVAAGRQLALTLLLVTVLAVAAVAVLSLWLVRRLASRPLRQVVGALELMAEGRLDRVAVPMSRGGEVGAIAAAARALLTQLRRDRLLERDVAAERAARDRRQAALDQMTSDFGQSVVEVMPRMMTAVLAVRSAAADMARVVDRTGAEAGRTAADAEGSARNLSTVAVATSALTVSAGEVAQQVSQVSTAARGAVAQAEATGERVRGLSAAAAQIGSVVRVITDIAGQTNLLALNATIEAARAGAAGSGFAVVAGEVKQLAQQTARATEQIGEQVAAIRAATQAAVAAMGGVSQTIGGMDQMAAAIAAAAEEKGAATQEISGSVQSVAARTDVAVLAMREVAMIAEGARVTGGQMLAAAEEVASASARLTSEVDQFLTTLKAETGERRRHERVAGHGARVVILLESGAAVDGRLIDLSLGGAAVAIDNVLAAQSVQLRLPEDGGTVLAQVVRMDAGGVTALIFDADDEAAKTAVAAAIERLRGGVAEAA
jgi:methyl-accepting chemotaxis protein